MTTPIDIRADHLRIVHDVLDRHLPDGVRVWVFGSRATWATKDSSDLDLALEGDGEIPARSLAALESAFEDSDLPYAVDVVDVKRIGERFRDFVAKQRVRLPANASSHSTDWPAMSLREAGISLIDCEHRTPPASDDGYPYVGIPQITDGRLDLGSARRIAQEHFREWTRKANPRPFDVVLSRRCNPGDTGFVSARSFEFALGQNLVLLRADGERILKPFLRWLVRSPEWWNQIAKYLNVGAVFDSLKCVDIPEFLLPIPPLPDQRVIAHILGTLDDKSELNRRMNATLEAMARALFRSWFVDFDPVRAKMEGRDTGLPKDIADLFPDRLVDSELGEIPEGWIVKTLGDLCHKPQYGYTASARSEPVGPKFLRITDINKESWVSWSRVPYCEATDDDVSRYGLTKGDVLIARMADPGHGILVEEDVEAVFASYLIRFRPVEHRNARFLQYWLKSDAYWERVRGQAAGTTRVSLNARMLSLFPLLVPPDGAASAFATVVGALRDRLVQSATEMQVLSGLRDALLSKLVSGELRVRDAERLVGAIA